MIDILTSLDLEETERNGKVTMVIGLGTGRLDHDFLVFEEVKMLFLSKLRRHLCHLTGLMYPNRMLSVPSCVAVCDCK